MTIYLHKSLIWHLCVCSVHVHALLFSLCFQVAPVSAATHGNDHTPSRDSSSIRSEAPSWLEVSPSESESDHLRYYPERLPIIPLSSLDSVLEQSCALLAIPPFKDSLGTLFGELGTIFKDDQNVFIGVLVDSTVNARVTTSGTFVSVPENVEGVAQEQPNEFTNSSIIDKITWKSSHLKQVNQMKENMDPPKLAFYTRQRKDKTCLLTPPRTRFRAEPYTGQLIVETLVQFLNERCGPFRTPNGALTAAGLFHDHIMKHLYTPREMMEECKRIKIPETTYFFQEFLFRSRPVVIENGVTEWPAMTKWSMEYLRKLYGEKVIHIKLTEDGNFEGVESAKDWNSYHEDWIPEEVRKQLPFPDLVVVRPATDEMKFSDFLDFISTRNKSMYSAYLEYSSIPYYMPQLEKDIAELPFLEHHLERRHLNMWLSDGDTLGKLHFDPYDNFLCQISGEKHLTLFDPHHNENLYEAHIPEAILSFSRSSGKFHRNTLLESTSMVMSPVDIKEPDLERFPNFAKARRIHCALKPGDVLFMPAFWWHEVQSFPDKAERRNLAVNFWYEPLLTKEFPCAECRLEFNTFYRHFLYSPPAAGS